MRRHFIKKPVLASQSIRGWWDRYYDVVSEKAFADLSGLDELGLSEYSCAGSPGYECEHVAWMYAKPEYREILADYQNFDQMELVTEGDDPNPFPGYMVGGRVYELEESEIEEILSPEEDEAW